MVRWRKHRVEVALRNDSIFEFVKHLGGGAAVCEFGMLKNFIACQPSLTFV